MIDMAHKPNPPFFSVSPPFPPHFPFVSPFFTLFPLEDIRDAEERLARGVDASMQPLSSTARDLEMVSARMSHVSCMHESCLVYTHMSESCLIYGWVMSHI